LTRVGFVTDHVREVVNVDSFRDADVVHYSIPAFDAVGGAIVQPGSEIESDKLAVRRGDVLVSRLNPRKSRVLIVTEVGRWTLSSTEFVVLRPKAIDARYLMFLLRSETSRQALDAEVRSVTRSQQRVDPAFVRRIAVPVLDIERQRTIADALARECERIQALDLAFGAMAAKGAEAFLSDQYEAIGIDRHPTVQIRYVARTGTGHTPSRTRPEWWVAEECVIPWFTLADVHQIREDAIDVATGTAERISPLGVANSSAVVHPAGTVLLSRTASVGFSAIMGVDMAVSQDFMTWTCGPRLRPRFLLYALRASRLQLRRLMYGSTHHTIYMPDLLSLRVPLPPLREQDAAIETIARRQSAHHAATAAIKRSRARLAEYRDALITEAVTGRLDVSKIREARMDERLHAVTEGDGPTDTLTYPDR
jgi:type I restriction enzyme, S subunit